MNNEQPKGHLSDVETRILAGHRVKRESDRSSKPIILPYVAPGTLADHKPRPRFLRRKLSPWAEGIIMIAAGALLGYTIFANL